MTKHNHVESHSASQTHKSEHQGNYAGHHHKIRSEHHDDPLLEAQTACSKLLSCASDTWARSKRASEVVGGGMINGAVKEAQKEFKHPEQLAKHAWDAGVAHVSGAGIGLAAKAYPPIGIVAGGWGLYCFSKDSAPRLYKDATFAQQTWSDAYNCNDAKKLDYYKQKVEDRLGKDALWTTTDAVSAAIGLGAGLKGGSVLKSRWHGMEAAKNALHQRSHVDEFGTTRIYQPNKAIDIHYADGSKMHIERGITTSTRLGETRREVPGTMRIIDKRNGDRIYIYHATGETHTHKPSGTVIKELPDGVVETHRPNGRIYREHPDGKVEIK